MILDALKYMVALGKRNIEVQKIELPGDMVMVVHGDTVEKFHNNRLIRSDAPTTVADLLDWTKFVVVEPVLSAETDVECFVDELAIRILVNREQSVFDKATLALRLSAEWVAVDRLLRGPISQKELITLMRGPLAKAIQPNYLAAFRGVRFRSTSTTERGNSTLGRSVDLEVASTAGELPDELSLLVPVYDPTIVAIGIPVIQLAVEVNFDTEKFEFIAVGDTLKAAMTDARKEIRSILVEGLPEGSLVVLGNYDTTKAAV